MPCSSQMRRMYHTEHKYQVSIKHHSGLTGSLSLVPISYIYHIVNRLSLQCVRLLLSAHTFRTPATDAVETMVCLLSCPVLSCAVLYCPV